MEEQFDDKPYNIWCSRCNKLATLRDEVVTHDRRDRGCGDWKTSTPKSQAFRGVQLVVPPSDIEDELKRLEVAYAELDDLLETTEEKLKISKRKAEKWQRLYDRADDDFMDMREKYQQLKQKHKLVK